MKHYQNNKQEYDG